MMRSDIITEYMDIARIFFLIALYTWGMCWLCNIMTLFSRPHKWSELLIFTQLVWCALGIVGVEYFKPQTEVQWCFIFYGYPILLLPIQFFACRQFLFLYKAGKQENEKFLYLAISQIVSMIMLSLLWILSGYALIWSQAS